MTWSAAAITHLQESTATMARWLLWLRPMDRDTGERITFGIWNGDDNQTFTVGGDARVYLGAQGAFSVDPVIEEVGTVVRSQNVRLSSITPEVEAVARGYDLRLAPAELHLALLDPESAALIDLQLRFRGQVTSAPIPTPPVNGSAPMSVTIASSWRGLTRLLPLRKSDAAQRARDGDGFRKYGSISQGVRAPWGGK